MRVMVLAVDTDQLADLSARLANDSVVVDSHSEIRSALDALHRYQPDLVVCSLAALTPTDLNPLSHLTRTSAVPTLAVVPDPASLPAPTHSFDDWLGWNQREVELAPRASRLIQKRSVQAGSLVDPRFLALVVHDLRTPLNVINLTVRAIGQSVKSPGPDFDEDMMFLLENAKQIERMLAQLGDFCRLIEGGSQYAPLEFQTRRFLTDFLEEKQSRRDPEFKAVRLELTAETPEVVELDANRARLAIHHALANALVAAPEAPVLLRSRGSATEWVLDVIVEKAPPTTVSPTQLDAGLFERLIGSAAERRGLDLAIAARVSDLFGGTARLDIEPGRRSVVTLAWPVRPHSSS